MIENIRGLPGVYGIVSPAAYRSQVNTESNTDETRTNLHKTNNRTAGVSISISEEAMAMLRTNGQGSQSSQKPAQGMSSNESDETAQDSSKGELSEEEQKIVERLKTRDREVRAHEQAHLAAAGGLATSGAKFEFETGPDGMRYAVGGEVSISMRSGNTPEETIRNAEQVQRAALAPVDPSPQDRSIAADAASKAMEARMEIVQEATHPEAKEKPAVQKQAVVSEKANISQESGMSLAGEKAAITIRGRQEISKISQGERGIFMGYQFSSLSFQA